MLKTLLFITVISCSIMLVGWLIQRKTKNAGIVDILWGICMTFSANMLALFGSGALLPRLLLAVIASFWGIRLTAHLITRFIREKHEEGRYQTMRAACNDNQAQFLLFFMGQGISIPILSLPFLGAANNPISSWTIYLTVALLIALISLSGEAIADYQLAQHRQQNTGKVCQTGLWQYSRHPNYFFEWIYWFSYLFLAIGAGGWFWFSLLGPIIMLWLLLKISGIPYTEAQSIRSKGDAYIQYQQTTSAFFPWFPKQ